MRRACPAVAHEFRAAMLNLVAVRQLGRKRDRERAILDEAWKSLAYFFLRFSSWVCLINASRYRRYFSGTFGILPRRCLMT